MQTSSFMQKKWLFGHNFWTRNARWPIKVSKDSYLYNLVSTKNLSQKIGAWCWNSETSDHGQQCVNILPLW